MKALYLTVLAAIFGLLVFGCAKAPNPTEVPLSEQSGPSSLAKATVFHSNVDIPVDETVFSQCAGEFIQFTGVTHMETHTVVDANGGFHSQFTFNDNNISGVGQSSGTKYRRVGAIHSTFNISGSAPLEQTITNSFNFIGQGAKNNTLLIETYHVTVNANGEVTAFVNNSKFECR